MRRRLVATVTALTVVSAVSPAVAGGPYCGHSAKASLLGRQSFVQSWTDVQGDHRHTVSVIRWGSGTPQYVFPECST